ncbi:ribosomal protein S12 methylthiotransferase RimO [bacterium BMS3Bbin14]|nr:ribosomal protein S12 methylthiotransferase RimO [bacterium BMS3Abin13]GBE52659.1 ribosomal protein S12 methylthiotransferase RimO [bacterium BMS3Bbin14]
MKKLHLVSLGCPKNLVDSEVMLARLEQDGYAVVADPAEADLLLVNTCGFIGPAVQEAIDEILRLAEYKRADPAKLLVVTGCLVQRYGADLQKELPEVDLFTGTDGFQEIDALIRRAGHDPAALLDLRPAKFLMDSSSARRLSTPFFRSYLKITEGCDNRCSYCMIPSIRGKLRSRAIADLATEAGRLAAMGVRELTLIAQDLTAYGDERQDSADLVQLLKALLAGTDIPWIRLLYLYPTGITDELLTLMAAEPRLLPYLDIPFQHVADRVLRRMNRHYGRHDLETLVERVRRFLPAAALRTTLLVGFPGESEAEVEEMVDCLRRWRLDNVGVFRYADEDGCPAYHLADKVSAETKERRHDRVMKVQAEISTENQQHYVGMNLPVLVEGISGESDLLLEGRTMLQAPEIDGCVYITAGTADPGDIVQVRITEAHTYDLIGEIVEPGAN